MVQMFDVDRCAAGEMELSGAQYSALGRAIEPQLESVASYRTIGAAVGCSPEVARSEVHRALGKLSWLLWHRMGRPIGSRLIADSGVPASADV